MRRSVFRNGLLCSSLLFAGCAPTADDIAAQADSRPAAPVAAEAAGVCVPPPVVVDPTRSLAITDLQILNPTFSFANVMGAITASAAVVNPPSEVYHRIFDTNNPAPGLFPGPHCTGALNGFAQDCPRQEGVLADAAAHAPFCTGAGCDPYEPLGLFNRFDLADAGGANCGEYRIVFGKRSAGAPPPGNNRNLIIFEAQLQNPNPGCGMDGCRPVAQFWANLSTIANPLVRQAELQRFYFTGLPGFSPVFDWKNYSGPKGQIRSNQFMTAVSGQPWQLKEYKLRRDCSAGPCVLLADNVTVKTNPFSDLFNPLSPHPKAPPFQNPAAPNGFIPQVASLQAATTPAQVSMSIDNFFNTGQSTSVGGGDADYLAHFGGGGGFGANIAAAITVAGLTPQHIVRRAQTQSCAGCHQLSNAAPANDLGNGLFWPPSLGFTHVSDTTVVPCATALGCWQISPALATAFLPARKTTLETFVTSTWCNPACP